MVKDEIGSCVRAKIVLITDTSIFIDIGGKAEGVVDISEFFDISSGKVTVKVGDVIEVFYIGYYEGAKHFAATISEETLEGQNEEVKKTYLSVAFSKKISVKGQVINERQGGYDIKIGTLRAFCPKSLMFLKKEESIRVQKIIGSKLNFRIIELKSGGDEVAVLSRKELLVAEENKKIDAVFSKIKEGEEKEVSIKSIGEHGINVLLEGLDAFIPISQVSYERLNRREEIEALYKEEERVKVKVIECSLAKREGEVARYNIKCSIKALEREPFCDIESKYKVGDKKEGVVEKVLNYGVFIKLEAGITGFIHISKLPNINYNTNLQQVYHRGEKVNIVIDKIDKAAKRIELSFSSSEEEDTYAKKYIEDQEDLEGYNPFKALLKH